MVHERACSKRSGVGPHNLSRRGWREAESQGDATAFAITASACHHAATALPIAIHAATAFAFTATAAGAASCAAMPRMLPIVIGAM